MTVGTMAMLACLALAPAAARAQAPEAEVLDKLSSGTPDERRQALDTVVARPAAVAAADLFMASAVAGDLGRLEDAGFLLYAAQVRGRVDLERFPPKVAGGDDPAHLLGTLSAQIGQPLNKQLMRDPKVFRAVLARLRAWDPLAPEGYDPGWEHGDAPQPLAQAKAAAETMKADLLRPAENMARLLDEPEYLAAFKVLQEFDLARTAAGDLPHRVAAVRKAEQTMAGIEKTLGIPGLYSAPKGPAASPLRSPPARRVGGAIAEPRRLAFVQPVMPPDLPPDVPRTVILELTVDEGGRVVDASVLRGHPAVDQAVAQAVSRWVYEPAREHGRPVPVVFTVTLNLR